MKNLLEALDFLHTEANVTHCGMRSDMIYWMSILITHVDLKLSNIMFGVEDESVFEAYEEVEMSNPSRSKTISQVRKLYTSRPFRKPQNYGYGPPILCDFGEARIGADHAHVDIQPEIYKAPEILMETGWNHSADIWNAACLVRSPSLVCWCVSC
jgi:serine/threonine protein kinase